MTADEANVDGYFSRDPEDVDAKRATRIADGVLECWEDTELAQRMFVVAELRGKDGRVICREITRNPPPMGGKFWHDVDVTLARHIRRLEAKIAALEKAACKSQ